MATTKGPGEFFTAETLREVMDEQRRPRIGGDRTYGDEWDDYFIPRGWKATQPMLNADVREKAANILRNLKAGVPIEDQIAKRPSPDRPRNITNLAQGTHGTKTLLSMSDLNGLGEVDLVTAVRDIHAAVTPVAPLLETVGSRPYATIITFMLAVGVGAYLGGFIGARGLEVLKKKLGW